MREMIRTTLDLPTAVGSPTHRAAMILRRKGIDDASTLHSLALTPYFLGDYAWAHRWLGEDCPARAGQIEERTPDVDKVPFLLHGACGRVDLKPRTLLQRARRYGAKKALASLGINGKQYFDGFGAKQGEGVLLIDEASMVGTELLALCLDAFPQVVLVGDPGQLPPVKDRSALEDVLGFTLAEIHRQAADNPIITLAYEARTGTPNWQVLPLMDGRIAQHLCVEDPAVFLTAPLIVWRNETRLECTKGIRAALGYWHGKVEVGEPLVCRATSAADRAEGLVNNSLWRVVERHKTDERRVTLEEDGGEGRQVDVLLHLEDVDGDDIDPEAVPFRFGYCLTAHTAQGGEWPTVYLSKPDLLAHQAFCRKRQTDEHARWSYTAITRAKDTLVFLQEHRFLAAEERPMMPVTMTVAAEPTVEAPGVPVERFAPAGHEPDDIPDPVVPAGTGEPSAATPASNGATPVSGVPPALLPMAHGFCDYIQNRLHGWLLDEHRQLAQGMDVTMSGIRDYAQKVLQCNEHAEYQLANALEKIQKEGLAMVSPPYQAVVQATTPSGLPLTLTITKLTAPELVNALTNLEAWLTQQGYTVPMVA